MWGQGKEESGEGDMKGDREGARERERAEESTRFILADQCLLRHFDLKIEHTSNVEWSLPATP